MDNLNSIMIYAFRYALGRSTYAVADVCKFIKENIRVLNKTDLKVIEKEIRECQSFGMEIDRTEWFGLYDIVLERLR